MRHKVYFRWPGSLKGPFVMLLMLGCLAGLFTVTTAQKSSRQAHRSWSPADFKAGLRGPILSAPTAFTRDLEIDYAGMKKVMVKALDQGCKVVALTSGNSRYDRISYAEVRKITEMMVETVGDRGLTIAATGNWGMDTILDYVRYAESIGASAVQVDLPTVLAADTGTASAVRFYRTVAAHTHLGIVLHGYYSESLLNELIKIKSIVALKEDVADLNYYVQRQIVYGDRLAIFAGGTDSRFLFGHPYGSPAYFSTLYSYAPAIGWKYWQAIQSHDLKTAVRIVNRYDIPFMKHWSFPFWAAAIEYMGGSERYVRPKQGETAKQETLSADEWRKMREIMDSIGLRPLGDTAGVTVTEGLPLPVQWKRGGHVGGVVDGSVVIGGGNQWSADKQTKYWLKNTAVFRDGAWKAGPDLPKPLAYAMYATDSSGLYVAGGTEDGVGVERNGYRLHSLQQGQGWESLPPLPVGVGYGAGAILQGKFYVACGSLGKENTNRMWMLDLRQPGSRWQECAPLPGTGRMFPAMAAAGPYLYLLGGLAATTPLTVLKDSYRYDPVKNAWQPMPDLPMEGYAWESQPVDATHLIMTGRAYGRIDTGIWILNLEDMSMKLIDHNLHPATTAPLISRSATQWWLVGGEPDANKNRSARVSVITLH